MSKTGGMVTATTRGLGIRLLGSFDLRREDGGVARLESARAISLLAYLALRPDAPATRQQLAFMLWPDSSESQARTNLRHVLHNLRRAIPDLDAFLDAGAQTLRWKPDAPCEVDALRFVALVNGAREADDAHRERALLSALDLYAGDLLEGIDDEWVLDQRERLRAMRRDALAEAVRLLEARGEVAQALEMAERMVRHDPLDEGAYRVLMRLHDATGNRALAARVFHECVAILQRELGVDPSEQTVALYESLLPGEPQQDAPRAQSTREVGPPLVGRREERERLIRLWREATAGQPRLVALRGEAGAGKTRLADELVAWCSHHGTPLIAAARAYAAEGTLGLGPVAAWLRSQSIFQRVRALPPGVLSDLSRVLPELSALPGASSPEPLPESEQRRRVYDAMGRALLAGDEPLLLVADDLQWFDGESIRFLHYLLRAMPRARLLVVATVRDEEIDAEHPVIELFAGLRAIDRLAEVAVGRLSRGDTGRLAAGLIDGGVSDAMVDDLYRETEGNPLFLVETIRAGWSATSQDRTISPRVQSVIHSRLLQLSPMTRDVVGIAATIGRAFSADTLKRAAGLDEQALVRCLDELWRRHIIDEQGIDGYDFTHDKIREVAYLSLSPALRRQAHLRVAAALEPALAADPASISAQIATHYEQAGAVEPAVEWRVRASDAARQQHASADAVRQLRRALDLLRSLPETPERQARELAILSVLPGLLVAVDGFRSEYVSEVHDAARALAATLGVELAPPLLWSMAVAHLPNGQFEVARSYGERLRAVAQRSGDDVQIAQSDYVLGITAYWSAELDDARRHFEAVIARCRPEHRRDHLWHYGQDPLGICQMRLAFVYWFLGRVDDALRARDEVVAESVDHEYWFNRLSVLHFAGLLAIETGDDDFVREVVAVVLANRAHYDAPYIEHIGEALINYADVLDGNLEAGTQRLERVLDSLAAGNHMPGQWSSLSRVLLAARELIGEPRAGLAAADRLLEERDGVRLWTAEAWRMRAEFLEHLDPRNPDVDLALANALDTARRQGARSLELRAATSLLRVAQGRNDAEQAAAARARIVALLSSMPSTVSTRDLRKARRLLAATN